MQRIPLTPRPSWQQIVESQGLTFHSLDIGTPYWDESAAYQFTAAEIDTLEAAANELQTMCLAATQHIIDTRRYADLLIPAAAVPAIEAAWNAEPPALYGRFDLLWSGAQSPHPPKLLEYNADTPTSLLEAAVIQWNWLEDLTPTLPTPSSSSRPELNPSTLSSNPKLNPHTLSSRPERPYPISPSSRPEREARSGETPAFALGATPKPDQFNSLHERLIAKWRDLTPHLQQPIYFAGIDTPEDTLTLAYIEDTAQQAGLQTRRIPMLQIGWNAARHCFVDVHENQIQTLFKLYPWETMLAEDFGPHALQTYTQLTPNQMIWIEPIWKLLLSNKGLLPILWELFPNHPNLLESHFDNPHEMSAYVRKPLLSREGQNISITYANSVTIETPGTYNTPDARYIFQALAPEATFPDALGHPRHPVLGLWMIDQECAGMGIRESTGPITDNLSSFVPHLFR